MATGKVLEQFLGHRWVELLTATAAKAGEPSPSRETSGSARPRMAKLVVHLPLLRVRKDLVGLVHFLEHGFSGLVPRVAVRVILPGQFPVRLLDVIITGGSG